MKKSLLFAVLAMVAVLFSGCNNKMKIKQMPYPETARGETVDDYFGTEVGDPYRWLEDDNSAETAEWVKAENAVTFDYLSQIPFRDAIKERLTELWNYPKESAPYKKGDWYYISKNDGLQNQSVLYRTRELGGELEVFIDPNTLSTDGTVALSGLSFSEDGKYAVYALSSAGSDWVNIKVMDTATKEDLPDQIKWVKNGGGSWSADCKGFYYSGYDAPKSNVYSAQNQNQKVFYHRLGTAQSADQLIYADPTHPLRYFGGWESEDGKWVFVYVSEGTSGSEILYRAKNDKQFKTLFAGFDYDYGIVDCQNDVLYATTNEGAENYCLISVNLNTLERNTLIAERESLLEGVGSVGGVLFATYLEDAQNKVYRHKMDGTLEYEVELPAIGTVGGFGGETKDTDFYFGLTNFTTPSTIYHYDIASGKIEQYLKPDVKFDPDMFVTEQVFYESKDGTKVPMFITHRKDMKRNGKNPCYLYAYGGFQINMTPGFSTSSIMFMEQGGIYCIACLRGGSEYGESWHKAGMLENKQNVFDDFIAAAQYLVDNKYTSTKKLAIAGGSNGGLLVGACEVQRPDLYAVCLPAVGVMDMLRYHKFTIGWGWAVEYGTSDNEEQFDYIYKYSPLHNIRSGVEYPATLVTTGDHDDRVVPAHSFKYAAQMQHAQSGDKPILIRIETNAGHGAGKPTTKRIEEAADTYAFLFYNTDTEYKTAK